MMKYENKVLIDWSGFGKTIGDVQGSFSLLEFLDFCTVLEGMCLYDQMVPVGKKIKGKWEIELSLLENAGVLSPVPIDAKPANIGQRPEQTNNNLGLSKRVSARSSLIDSWYESGRLIGGEIATGVCPLPLIRQRTIYERFAYVREEHSVCDLVFQYADLSKALINLRENTRVNIAPYLSIPIPPIPLIVIERSRSKEDFLAIALELREEFSPLREKMTELRSVLDDPEASISDKIKFRKSWGLTWKTLERYKNFDCSFEIANAVSDKINIERSLDGLDLSSFRLTKFAEKAISEAAMLFHRFRIRPLHRAASNYLKKSDGAISREIERLYKREVRIEDFHNLSQFGVKPP